MSLLPGVKAWTAADDRRQASRVANLMVLLLFCSGWLVTPVNVPPVPASEEF